MIEATPKRQLPDEIERLSPEKLARVYEDEHALTPPPPPGASIDDLIALAGTIDDVSALQMTSAIDEAFERVDSVDW